MADREIRTLGELKTAARGRRLFVKVFTCSGCNGYDIQVSLASFLSSIGADVPFSRDGLHDSSRIDATVLDNEIYIGVLPT